MRRLKKSEWRAISAALAFAMAGEWDEVDDESSFDDAESALQKVWERIGTGDCPYCEHLDPRRV